MSDGTEEVRPAMITRGEAHADCLPRCFASDSPSFKHSSAVKEAKVIAAVATYAIVATTATAVIVFIVEPTTCD